ncbi:CaiB/BaiF CoA transferase family protein [Aminobacter ciceronei]|uniref:Crotonobetainyl-CoA:carnitine CoA-transferase CaiB-like acyl-CoA transferase n=1 Tax=Aminobacter ciceronei TaxID=150723 RepID=A0ABR6CGH9_9HYPH|nr:CaiB/BaiF CoA-transferase family protein [Aminobacter ciceronei]MBA8909941.1 crotonobetainyl-CoA:carnitine CoA-transferase CaiB-like acyl-CoA transferase [Aminobacter ciceronei]MBA9023713.1 crotonobetainyl-CoA:carnitine CoA-transferase CaiB-like acyl-CoA transferase [Aminobacter ciceronei]
MKTDLEGILVVSIEQAVAAPYLSCKLADAGARVLKIERPEGDFARQYDHLVHGESAYFVWLNRGKESICLDLKQESDRAVLMNMVSRADVFIQNLAPGAIDRMGFGVDLLRQRFPRLITCSISGYGDEGPRREAKAYDLLVQAESGLSAITGNEHGLARVGVSVCDIAAGMTATQAVLQALYARRETGEGRHVAVSLYHALSDWMNVPYLQFVYGGKTPVRSGLNHPTIAPYGAYTCADGKALLFSIQNEREWVNFCGEGLGRPELATDELYSSNSRRVQNREKLDSEIVAIISTLDRDQFEAKLQKASIAFGRVSTLDEVVVHPQNRYVSVDTPTGPVQMLAPGAVVNGNAPTLGSVPALGADTERLRREFSALNAAAYADNPSKVA